MDRRVMGVETEYGVHFSHSGGHRLAADEVARYLFRPVMDWGGSSNVFIPNASRLYLDVGSHPEVATAECSRADELIAADKAGELILNRLVDDALTAMHQDGFQGNLYLYRNNADSQGNAFGSHENYLITRTVPFRRLTEALVPFLVTRQLFTGAGAVITDPSSLPQAEEFPVNPEPHFAFSQRADYVQDGVSSSSTRSRPIINTRDEPHADAAHHRRLHVIVGDSNMSETTQLVRFATTDLMLRIIESGTPLEDLQLAHPVRAIHEVSHDLTGRTAQIRLRNGDTTTALGLQERFYELASRFLKKNGPHHDYLPQAMDLWRRTLDAVSSGDYSSIDTEIDWAIKQTFLTRYAEKNSLDFGSPRLKQLDMSYHDINRSRGLFYLLQANGSVARFITDDQIRHAVNNPPATTRAAVRHYFITRARELGLSYTVDWTHLKLCDLPLHTIHTKDPFTTDTTAVDSLFNLLPST